VAVIDRGRLLAVDSPARLKAAVHGAEGRTVTLEDVFLALTRRQQ